MKQSVFCQQTIISKLIITLIGLIKISHKNNVNGKNGSEIWAIEQL